MIRILCPNQFIHINSFSNFYPSKKKHLSIRKNKYNFFRQKKKDYINKNELAKEIKQIKNSLSQFFLAMFLKSHISIFFTFDTLLILRWKTKRELFSLSLFYHFVIFFEDFSLDSIWPQPIYSFWFLYFDFISNILLDGRNSGEEKKISFDHL